MLIYFLQDCFNITYYPKIDHDILIHLCRINVNLKNLRIFCKCCSISRYTVTESCSCYDQKIAFTYPKFDAFVPCIPSIPVYLSSVPGKAPFPIRESVTGASTFCANSCSLLASERTAPPPTKIYGLLRFFDHLNSFLEILFLLNGSPLGYIHLIFLLIL